MQVKLLKLSPNIPTPTYQKVGDAGIDLVATSKKIELYYIEYGTSIALQIPEGYVGMCFPRSSITNKGLILGNSVGIIDENYRGEIKFRFYLNERFATEYEIGDRIGQIIIMPYPKIEFVEVDTLSETDRGIGGYGSTGK